MAAKKKNIPNKQKAIALAEQLVHRKGEDIVVLDLSEQYSFTDFFIICSANSITHAKALLEHIKKFCKKEKYTINHQELDNAMEWIIIDCFDVIIHIFQEDARRYYNLERICREAEKIPLPS